MLRQFKRVGFIANINSKPRLSTSHSETWDLASSVCLERKPTLTKQLNDMESNYSKVLQKLEFEMSFKSDHEIRMIKDKLYAEELKKNEDFLDSDTGLQTGQEFEDASEDELKKFRFAERITEDDLKNDTTSTNRKLSSSLLLFIKHHLGNNPSWVMPLSLRQGGETMRQVAERALIETCGVSLKTKFLGNSPCGFYKFKYPKSSKNTESVGMKIFFFKAQLISGNVSKELCPEFQWLAEHELDSKVFHEDYLRNIKMFLLHDDNPITNVV